MNMANLQKTDPEISKWIQHESERQKFGLEMIASENYTSKAVMEAQGSILTNKYAEGYPSKRYYGGCEFVDHIESLAIERACKLYNCEAANVQPHSGSQANMAVYLAFLKPGDVIMGMDLAHGGHLTHGAKVNFSGTLFHVISYGLDPVTHRLNMDTIRQQAREHRPQLIVAGYSAYSRKIDFAAFRSIADEVGAFLMVDMAHFAGLVAGGQHESPIPYADVVTSTTHKTLRGPRGGLILSNQALMKKINSKIFPGIQGGPLEHVIAGKAVAFQEALQPEFKLYAQQVVRNAQTLAQVLIDEGYSIVTGGTDNHLLLVDLSSKEITGQEAEIALDRAGITVNKNTVPNEKRSPFVTSGIRIGTPALTTRGMKESEMQKIGKWIAEVLRSTESSGKSPTQETVNTIEKVRRQVHQLCELFPIYG